MDQVATGSPDVELNEADFAEPVVLEESAVAATEQVTATDYVENIAEVLPGCIHNAATLTPPGIPPLPVDTPMIPASDGDLSEYEAHFSKGALKDDKARKLASRTPENEGKPSDKLGKKQRKQLQFSSQEVVGTGNASPRGVLNVVIGAEGGTGKEPSSARQLKNAAGVGEPGATSQASGKVEKRRGKAAVAGTPVGK
ncbi:unnamed protein product [Calypogeia fissa]